jgi:ketosteroid isomerase-like protein
MRTVILANACVFLLASTLAAAPSERQQILDLEHRWLDAAMTRDLPALREILADDFVDVSWRGEIRRKADLLRAPAVTVKSSQVLSDLEVRFHGKTAIVTGVNTTTAADESFTARIRFTDVFVKRNGRWQAVSAQETPERGP